MKRSGRIDVILIVLILYLLGLTQGCSGVNEAVKSTVPGGPLLVEPPNAVYAPRRLLSTSPSQLFVVTNPSSNSGSAIITSVETKSDQFLLDQGESTCPTVGTLPAGLSCKIAVQFAPNTVGNQSATLTINDNATNSPQTVKLEGTGLQS
jgi:hypothetical protein